MLQSLHIENYVLIRELDIRFGRGFSVITGETGSGKSILLGALHLALGGRQDGKVLRDGTRKCVIEAVFGLGGYGLENFFLENDLDYDDTCTFRREMTDSGKSRLFLNDTPCPAGTARELGAKLMDIHSQHANLLLKESGFQLSVVDTMAGNAPLTEKCAEAFGAWRQASLRLEEATAAAVRQRQDADYTRFQYNQLAEARLTDGEQEEMEAERQTLEHASDIQEALMQARAALQDDGGALASLSFADGRLRPASEWGERYRELYDRLHSAAVELKDIAGELNRASEGVEANPARLEQVSERLDLIYSLEQKHQVNSVAALLEKQAAFGKELETADNWEEEKARMEREVSEADGRLRLAAAELHKRREAAIPPVVETLTGQLVALGIPNARIDIRLEPTEMTASGADRAVILFSANRQMEPRPIAQTASGGEMARVMLCVKAMMARSIQLPTILFDEIDTGVSGETAARMAGILKRMAENTQVICITHLPQIAAPADAHYKVYKEDNGQTETRVTRLDREGREKELAKMLSGERLTGEALSNARALLDGK